jgi:hypothetical protein
MKKVVIVNAGGRGDLSAEKGSYQSIVDYLGREVNKLTLMGKPNEKIAEVQVVNSVQEARNLIRQTDVMFFMTAGLLPEARNMKQENKRAKVIVMTGLLPEDDVVMFDKAWFSSPAVDSLVRG